MPAIAVVGGKGGVGKTTLAINIAAGLCRRGTTVLLDADPQRSAWQWSAIGGHDGGFRVVEAAGQLQQAVSAAVVAHDFVVIDCPPSARAPQTLASLRHADLALVPVQPSPMDLWATVHVVEAVDEARRENPGLRALLVINQLESRTVLSRLARMAVEELELGVAATAIRRRAIYRTSALEGRSVYAMGRRGEPAATEMNQLIEEVIGP